jgi:hypothetical protein
MKIEREPFIRAFSRNVRVMPFEDMSGAVKCWSMGRQSAEDFCRSHGINMSFPVFTMETRRYTTVKLFFPIRTDFYLTTIARIQGAPTLLNILKAIEEFAQLAIDIGYGITDTPAPPMLPSAASAASAAQTAASHKAMRGLRCCHLVVSRSGGHNKIFVRLTH